MKKQRRPHAQSCDNHPRFLAGCAPCQKRGRDYEVRRALRGTPASAPAALTIQRVRQLRALGYPITALMVETGLSEPEIKRLSHGKWDRVQLQTFHAVEHAHRRLRDLPGPSARSRLWAQKHGWTPPDLLPAPEPLDEQGVDDVAVDRAVAGERVPLTRAETAAAWAVLEARGMTPNKIAERLHTTEKTVQRWRSGKNRPASSRAHKRTA